MKRNGLLIIIIIALCIIIFTLFKENKKLNSEINSYENYICDYTMVHLTNDWIIPTLNQEELNINRLYQLIGRLESSHSVATRIFGINSEIQDYLYRSIKKLEKLIELMESNSTKDDIKKLIEETISLQKEILNKYSDFY